MKSLDTDEHHQGRVEKGWAPLRAAGGGWEAWPNFLSSSFMRGTIFFSRKPTQSWRKSCSYIHIKHLLWLWTPNNGTPSDPVFQTSSAGTPMHTQVICWHIFCEILTFKDWVGLQKLFFHLVNLCPFSTHSSYIGHDKFAGLCGGEPKKTEISSGKKAVPCLYRLNLHHISQCQTGAVSTLIPVFPCTVVPSGTAEGAHPCHYTSNSLDLNTSTQAKIKPPLDTAHHLLLFHLASVRGTLQGKNIIPCWHTGNVLI